MSPPTTPRSSSSFIDSSVSRLLGKRQRSLDSPTRFLSSAPEDSYAQVAAEVKKADAIEAKFRNVEKRRAHKRGIVLQRAGSPLYDPALSYTQNERNQLDFKKETYEERVADKHDEKVLALKKELSERDSIELSERPTSKRRLLLTNSRRGSWEGDSGGSTIFDTSDIPRVSIEGPLSRSFKRKGIRRPVLASFPRASVRKRRYSSLPKDFKRTSPFSTNVPRNVSKERSNTPAKKPPGASGNNEILDLSRPTSSPTTMRPPSQAVDLLDGEAAAQLMLLSMHPNGNNGFSRLAPENNAFVSSGSENGPPPVPQTRISPPAQSPPRILIPSNMPPLSSEVLSVSSQSPRPTISGRQATPPQRHSSFSPKGSISPERQVASPNSRRSVQPDPNAPNAVFKGLSLTERTEALNSYMAARTVAYASDCKSKGYPPGAAKRYSGEALEGYVTKHAQEELIQELFKEHKKTNVGRKHNPFWRSSSKNSSRALGAKSPLITTISPSPPPGSTEETRLGVAASPTSNRLVIPGTSQSLPPEEMLKISSPLNAFRTSRKSATPEASTIPQNPTNLERARLNVSPSPSVKGAPRRSITPKTSNLIGKSNQEQIDSLSSQDKTAAFHAFGIDISVDRPGSMKYLSKAEFNKKQYAGGVTGEALHWYAKTVKGRKDKDIINAFNLPDRIYVIAKPKF